MIESLKFAIMATLLLAGWALVLVFLVWWYRQLFGEDYATPVAIFTMIFLTTFLVGLWEKYLYS